MTIVFLLYDSRSGSTLLSALLNRYKGISVSQETGFIPIVLEYNKIIKDVVELDRLLLKINKEIQYKELLLDEKNIRDLLIYSGFPLTKEKIIKVILGHYFNKRDNIASTWIVKSPRIFFHINEILHLLPGVRFIHICRDGRAVFNSKRDMFSFHGRKTQSNLIKAAIDWKKRMKISDNLGNKVIEVKYEALLKNPDSEITRILDYLEICPEDREVTKDQSEYSSKIGQQQKHLHVNLSKKPDITHADKWKNKLMHEDIVLYEIFAGNDLKRKGYPILGKSNQYFSILSPKVFTRLIFYIIHQLVLYASNVWWYIFVDKSFLSRLRSKLYELKSD